jgi:hypothetical protein
MLASPLTEPEPPTCIVGATCCSAPTRMDSVGNALASASECCQIATAVLDANDLTRVALHQRLDAGMAEGHAAQEGDVVQQQLQLAVINATHHLRHGFHDAGIIGLAKVRTGA